jgi:hypothetical protein
VKRRLHTPLGIAQPEQSPLVSPAITSSVLGRSPEQAGQGGQKRWCYSPPPPDAREAARASSRNLVLLRREQSRALVGWRRRRFIQNLPLPLSQSQIDSPERWARAPKSTPSRHWKALPITLSCLALALLFLGPAVSSAQASFGFLPGAEGFNVTATEHDGSPDLQAASHPYQLTTTVNFKLGPESPGQPGVPFSDGDLRDLHLELPPGLIENPGAVPKCSQAQFNTPRESPFEASASGENCPVRTQIGVVAMRTSFGGGSTHYFGVFNVAPPPGAPSEIGFAPFGVPIALTPHIRQSEGEYGLTLGLENLSQRLNVYGLTLTIWGTPWNLTHNEQRGNCLNESDIEDPYAKCSPGRPRNNAPRAYLTLPSTCTAPMSFALSADSWQQPATVTDSAINRDEGGNPLTLEGCERLGLAFFETASVQPTNASATTSSGLDFNLELHEEGLVEPERLAPSQVKKAVVNLPEGMTINPSVGSGLGVCAPAQYAAETVSSPPGAGCPNNSKIGDVTVNSPLVEGPVEGSLFLAQPFQNPTGSLIAVYLVAKSIERGILVKVVGKVSPNPETGSLVATFDNLPQLPYTRLAVHFREGHRAPLVTPAACGFYPTQIQLSPWVEPDTARTDGATFQVTAGVGNGPCPAPGSTLPFKPGAAAGTFNANAGSYTPFYLHLTRTDGEQEITSYSAKLPPGLLGKLAGVPFCPDAAIEAAKSESGIEELEHPSCPAASEIGHTETGYGVGTVLAYAPGKLYLAGPYHGSPLSVVAVDSALVGPFDLGTIIVRSAIRVDPRTAQVSIDSGGTDPIPHIRAGIPIHLRDIRVYISRPNFMVNPTSCEPFSTASTLTGSGASFANPADDVPATVSDPFHVLFCSSLGFAPRVALKLKGGTKRGDYPQLQAVVTPRPGDANISSAAVTLPPSEFLAQNHIGTVCTRPQMEAEACPAKSVYGRASALTPLLSEPMQGPVYLRSNGGERPLPDLIAVLHGRGIRVLLEGHIDAVHGGLRGSFEGLPDAPLTKFTMTLDGGKRGLLVNAANICTATGPGTARLIGQNNTGEALKPRLEVRCGGHKKGKSRHRGGKS